MGSVQGLVAEVNIKFANFTSDLSSSTKSLEDASTGDSILNMYSGGAINVIEEMTMNNYQWSSERQTLRRE